ncbi:MAG: hypothetical protein U9N52_07180 [Campylobacterota bacterium]|nr:hypothetical protein [Campylobacterota bacterium]
MAKKPKRSLLSTLIIVGEGAHEKAFLSHLKALYSANTDQKVKIDSADGGSPQDIVRTAVKKSRHIDYDRKFILMDSDIAVDEITKKLAKDNNITIILSEPLCLEGMLLNLLGVNVPDTSKKCKTLLHPKLDGNPAEKKSYVKLIDKELLESSDLEQIVILLKIVQNIK